MASFPALIAGEMNLYRNVSFYIATKGMQEQSSRGGSYTNNFNYDLAGNPTTFKGASKSFNVDNQDTANTHDGAGNPTTYKGASLAFDAENRLTAYGTAMTAGYTSIGTRAWKQSANGTTYFLYDMSTPICEMNASGAVTATNTFGKDGLHARHTSAGSTFYTFDLQGNTAQRLSSAGTVLTSSMFDASGTGMSTGVTADPFNGHNAQWGYYTDSETGLESLTFRYYDPSAGRMLTRDPLGDEGGINLYSYVCNRAPNAQDPTGLTLIFCYRSLVLNKCHNKNYCHWYLKTDEPDCPYIGYGMSGVKFDGPSNEKGKKQYCKELKATLKEQQCICDKAKWAAGGGKLCDQDWRGKDYKLIGHNCQSFVQCLMKECGLPPIQ